MRKSESAMRIGKIMSAAAVAALIFASCKPTEQGYRAAYDAAKEKRETAAREQMLPATGLLSDDGPQRRVLDGDTLYMLQETLWDDTTTPARRLQGWHVAVGVYKMDTNAKGNAEALRGEGYAGARAARAKGDRHYTLAESFSTLDSARQAAKAFTGRHGNYPYVGLPGAPVIIR